MATSINVLLLLRGVEILLMVVNVLLLFLVQIINTWMVVLAKAVLLIRVVMVEASVHAPVTLDFLLRVQDLAFHVLLLFLAQIINTWMVVFVEHVHLIRFHLVEASAHVPVMPDIFLPPIQDLAFRVLNNRLFLV